MIVSFLRERKEVLIKATLFILIAFFFIGRALNGIEPYPCGDGPEYIMTTEAVYNHFTPDIRLTDIQSFRNSYYARNRWHFEKTYFDNLGSLLTREHKFMDGKGGVFIDKWGRSYAFHFFSYSMLNVPGRFIAEKTGGNPLIAFQVTNGIFVILTCFILLFFSPFALGKTILFVLSFCFSSIFWYLGWPHPEVLTASLVTLAFWYFFREKYYTAILLVALAGLQNQPLLVILVFMGIKTLIVKGVNLKNILKIGACSALFVWPPLFYFVHFHTTNLIKDAGFLDKNFITFTRVLGFYFDPNQGLILAVPLVLLLYIFLIGRKWTLVLRRREKFDFNYLLPFFLIAMTCIVSMMVFWNHGQAVVNRYVSWFSAIILVHTFFLVVNLRELVSYIVLNYIFVTQLFTTLYHQQFNHYDWGQNSHKPLAKFLLDMHPSWYNPDPTIFIIRTTHDYDCDPEVSPVFYLRDRIITNKIAVHKDKLDGLLGYGISKTELDRLKPKLHFISNWAYINRGEFCSSMNGADIYAMLRARKVKAFADRIRSHPGWLKQVQEKAAGWGISTEAAIAKDAEYLMWLEENQNEVH